MEESPKTSVLFVCVQNANRSQMAEAFAHIHGSRIVRAESAGSRPAPAVSPKAVAAMRERGYDLATHAPRGLAEAAPGPWDYVITMGCGDECPTIRAVHREDWALPDPKDMPPARFAEVRDEIEARVLGLLERVREER